jgi:hypothetical protein
METKVKIYLLIRDICSGEKWTWLYTIICHIYIDLDKYFGMTLSGK